MKSLIVVFQEIICFADLDKLEFDDSLLCMFVYDHPCNNQDHSDYIEYNGKAVRKRFDKTISNIGPSYENDSNDD